MSNDVRIYRTYTRPSEYLKTKEGAPYRERLFSRVEAATEQGLLSALDRFHKVAVQEAPMDTGLLKNSIFYTTDKEGSEIHGLNSFGGLHTVDEGACRDEIETQVIRSSERKGVKTGYVGTVVAHYMDTHPETYRAYVDEEGEVHRFYFNKRLTDYKSEPETYAKYSDDTQYAPYVEYGSPHIAPNPFMRRAMEKVRQEAGEMILKEFDKAVVL